MAVFSPPPPSSCRRCGSTAHLHCGAKADRFRHLPHRNTSEFPRPERELLPIRTPHRSVAQPVEGHFGEDSARKIVNVDIVARAFNLEGQLLAVRRDMWVQV